jgi:hypothetical protein
MMYGRTYGLVWKRLLLKVAIGRLHCKFYLYKVQVCTFLASILKGLYAKEAVLSGRVVSP